MPKLADSNQKRVPLNCLVRPDTKREIQERAVKGKSQGDVIDEAISALYRETSTALEPSTLAKVPLISKVSADDWRAARKRGIREKGDKSR